MNTKILAFKTKLKKECFIPKEEGRTVRNIPNIKIGFEKEW